MLVACRFARSFEASTSLGNCTCITFVHLKLHIKEAILAQGYVSWSTISGIHPRAELPKTPLK